MAVSEKTASKFELGQRRAIYVDITDHLGTSLAVDEKGIAALEKFDLWYRTLCAMLFNFVPTSGHPGGSVSSGHIVAATLVETMDYDFGDPERADNDLISYAAGHKALGLYAMWASRNEMVRSAMPDFLPDEKFQLRLEDMLGFRRNPTQDTALFKKFKARPLDGHPTPQVPFLRLSTGASGVGVPSSFGLALGALDRFGTAAPLVHVIEGEGGLTPGRTSEALATASAAQMKNLVVHLDWNQSSIDSDRVCREGDKPGDYVQWSPMEYFYLHDWNVIWVPDGFDFRQVLRAQQMAKAGINNQPTAIVYRTVKGWKYGIEGRKSHGAGHKFCSPEFFESLQEFEKCFGAKFQCACKSTTDKDVEECFYDALMTLRQIAEQNQDMSGYVAERLVESRKRLEKLARKPRPEAPDLPLLYTDESISAAETPAELKREPGSSTTLRGELGATLGYLNKKTKGAFIGAAADLLGSTSVDKLNADFPGGFYNAVGNPKARLIAVGGICEDSMGAFMSGLSSFGYNIGVGSSYAAFIAALQHIAARLHCIGQQARQLYFGVPFQTFIIVCGHAGLKTGEDGPTHADPQALQLLQENFPLGKMITLVPWDPQELWPLTVAGLKARPAVLAPFVTRPKEKVFDRKEYGLPPVEACVEGVYQIRKGDPEKEPYDGTIIIQGSAVMNDFVPYVLPRIDEGKLNMNVYYVASAELFDLLPEERQHEILPPERMQEAMGISDFTLPTIYRWVTSDFGRTHTIYAYSKGIYPGSGQAPKVLEEVGLNGPAQWGAIQKYVEERG